MGEIFPVGETSDEISIERCRELLGEEALDLTDDEVDRIRICAETVAQAVLETFLDESRPTIH
jgi:predicted RNA-binding Zn ribbon-like protein